jgi:hypothetical protein
MMPDKNTQFTMKSFMWLFKFCVISATICYHVRLFFIYNTRPFVIFYIYIYIYTQSSTICMIFKHKSRVKNKATYALIHRVTLLSMICVQVTRFQRCKEEYESCIEIREIYTTLRDGHQHVNDYYL